MSIRSERARRRAIKQRNQRLIALFFVILVVAGLSYLAYSVFTPKKAAAPAAATTIGGMQIQDLTVGAGQAAKNGDTLSVHYTGWLADGTKFDSSVDRGQPFEFTLGQGSVIQGWDQGMVGMQVGGKRKLVIPPEMAYGAGGAGGGLIPPNATLTFEVQLLAIK
jgi:FKBP-type peptidyl-prolyl cis-trans isomerase